MISLGSVNLLEPTYFSMRPSRYYPCAFIHVIQVRDLLVELNILYSVCDGGHSFHCITHRPKTFCFAMLRPFLFICLLLCVGINGETHSGRLRFASLPTSLNGYQSTDDRNGLYSLAVSTDPLFGALPYDNYLGDPNKATSVQKRSFEQSVLSLENACGKIIGGKRFCEMHNLCVFEESTSRCKFNGNLNDISMLRKDGLRGGLGTPHVHTPTNAQSISVWKNQLVASGSFGETVRRCDKNDPIEGGPLPFYDNLWLQSLYAYVICYTIHLDGQSDPGLPACSLDGMSCRNGSPIKYITPLKTYAPENRTLDEFCREMQTRHSCSLSDHCEWDPWFIPANISVQTMTTWENDINGACIPIGIENGAVPFAAGKVSYWGAEPGCKTKMIQVSCDEMDLCTWSRGRCIFDTSKFPKLVLRALGCRKQRSYGNILLPNAMNHSKIKEVNFTIMEDCLNINGTIANAEECQCPIPIDPPVCGALVTNLNLEGKTKSSCPDDDIAHWENPDTTSLDCVAQVAKCLANPFCSTSRSARTQLPTCHPVSSSLAHEICKKNSFCNSSSSGCVESPAMCFHAKGNAENSKECLCGNKICPVGHYCMAADSKCFVVNDCEPGKRVVLETPYPQLYKGKWQVCSDNVEGDDVCPLTLTGKFDNASNPLNDANCGTTRNCDYWAGLLTCPRLRLSNKVIYDPDKKTLVISGEKLNTQTIHIRLLPKALLDNCKQNYPVTRWEPDMSNSRPLEYFEANAQGGNESNYRNKITYTNVSVPLGTTYFVCVASDGYNMDILSKAPFYYSGQAPEIKGQSVVSFPKYERPEKTIVLNLPLLSNTSARIRIVDYGINCAGNPKPTNNSPMSLDSLKPVVNADSGGLDFVLRTVCGGQPRCTLPYCLDKETNQARLDILEQDCDDTQGGSYEWRRPVQYCQIYGAAGKICEAHEQCEERKECVGTNDPTHAPEALCQGLGGQEMATSESCALHREHSGRCLFYPSSDYLSSDKSECKKNEVNPTDADCSEHWTEAGCLRDPHCKYSFGLCSELCSSLSNEEQCNDATDYCFWDVGPMGCYDTSNMHMPFTQTACESEGLEWKSQPDYFTTCKRRPGVYSRINSNGWQLSPGTYKLCVDHNFSSSNPNFSDGGLLEIYDLITQSLPITILTNLGGNRPFNSTITLHGTNLDMHKLEVIIVDTNIDCDTATESKSGLPQKSELTATISDSGREAKIELCSPKTSNCPDLSSLTVGEYKICVNAGDRSAQVRLNVVEALRDTWNPGFAPGHRFVSEYMFKPVTSRSSSSLSFHFYGRGISSTSRIIATKAGVQCTKVMDHLAIGPVVTPTLTAEGPWSISLSANHLMDMAPGVYTLCMSLNGTEDFSSGGNATYLISPEVLQDQPSGAHWDVSKDLLSALGTKLWERCPQTCGDCVKCTDTPKFIDEQGFRCKDWQGLACSNAHSLYGYSLAGEEEVLSNCQCACAEKETMGTPAIRAHVVNDIATPKLQCSNCRPGWYKSSHDNSMCQPCQTGKVSMSGATTCIKDCPVGTYKRSSGCHNCPAGRTSTKLNAESCSKPCPGGTSAPEGSAECNTCPPGTYAEPEKASCTLCPAGTENPRSSSNSSVACITCPVGKYAVTGSQKCVSCSPGMYAAVLGASACRECLPGTYQDADGATSCSTCPSGTATRVAGAKSLTECNVLCDWASTTPNMAPRKYSASIASDNGVNISDVCQGTTKQDCEGFDDGKPGHGANCVFDDTPWNKNGPHCRPNQCNMYTNQPVCDSIPGCGWLPVFQMNYDGVVARNMKMVAGDLYRGCNELQGFYTRRVDDVESLDEWCDDRFRILSCSNAKTADECDHRYDQSCLNLGFSACNDEAISGGLPGKRRPIRLCVWKNQQCRPAVDYTKPEAQVSMGFSKPREGIFKLQSDCPVRTAKAVSGESPYWTNDAGRNKNGWFEPTAITGHLSIAGIPSREGKLPKISPSQATSAMCRDEDLEDCGVLFPLYPGGKLTLSHVEISGFRHRRGYVHSMTDTIQSHNHDYISVISLQTTANHFSFTGRSRKMDPSLAGFDLRSCVGEHNEWTMSSEDVPSPKPLNLEVCGAIFRDNRAMNVYKPSDTSPRSADLNFYPYIPEYGDFANENVWFQEDEGPTPAGTGAGVISVGSLWNDEMSMRVNVNPHANMQALNAPHNYAQVYIYDTLFEENAGASAGVIDVKLVSDRTNPTIVISKSVFSGNNATYMGSSVTVKNRLADVIAKPAVMSLINNTFQNNQVVQEQICKTVYHSNDGSTHKITLRNKMGSREAISCDSDSQCVDIVSSRNDLLWTDDVYYFPKYVNQDVQPSTCRHSMDCAQFASVLPSSYPKLFPFYLKAPDGDAVCGTHAYNEHATCPKQITTNGPREAICSSVYPQTVSEIGQRRGSKHISAMGGCICVSGKIFLDLIGNEFLKNKARVSPDHRRGAYGGAIAVFPDHVSKVDAESGDAFLNIFGNTFTNNYGYIGGAIYVGISTATVSIDSRNVFVSNKAAAAGGLIFSTSSLEWGPCQLGKYSLRTQQSLDQLTDEPLVGCFNDCPAGRYGRGQQ